MGRLMPGRGGFRNDNSQGREGEGRGSGSWGNGNLRHSYNEHDNNNGQFYGQAQTTSGATVTFKIRGATLVCDSYFQKESNKVDSS